MIGPNPCPACGGQHDRYGRSTYCRSCTTIRAREWRRAHRGVKKDAAARARDSARAMAGMYYRRGLMERTPCCVCGGHDTERHHPDYGRPLFIYWLCKEHHRAWHAHERASPMAKIETWLPPGSRPARIGSVENVSRENNAAFFGHPRA